MARAGIPIIGVALFARASAQGFDWGSYTNWDASGHATDSKDGAFFDYYRQYVQRDSNVHETSEKHSGGDYAGVPSAGQMAFFAEASTNEQNTSDHAAEALAAEHKASQRAEASIEELRQWDAKLKQDLESKNFSVLVAQGIVTKVQTSYFAKREELQRRFNAAMEALDATALARANSSVIKTAEDAASDVMEEFKHLDHAEAHAMRLILHSTEKAGKAKARALRKQAKEASHQAYRFGMTAAEAQRNAGVHRHIVEGVQRSTRRTSEHLERKAEEAAERVERLTEEQFREAERHLEKMMDDLNEKTRAAHDARRQRFHHVKDLIHESRGAAREEAAQPQPAQHESASDRVASSEAPQQKPTRKGPAQKGSAQEEPVQKDPTAHKESASQHLVSKKASQQEPAQKGSARSAYEEPSLKASQQEPAQKGSAQKGTTPKGSAHEEPVKKNSAQKQPAQKDPSSEQVASPVTLLTEDPALDLVSSMAPLTPALAKEQNVSDPFGEAQGAQREASRRAESIIEELRQWDAKLKQDLESKDASVTVAQGIVTKVQTSSFTKREELQRRFNAAMEALDATTLARANSSVIQTAEDAASDVMDEFKHLDHADAHAMRLILHSTEKAGKAEARTLRKQAKEASHQAYRFGMAAAEAQRKAGVHRHIVEGVQRSTRRASEHLKREAEEAAEKVERLTEEQFREAERHLEKMMDDLDGKSREAHDARRQRFHHVKDLIHESRWAAHEEAARMQRAQNESASDHMVSPKASQQKPAQDRPAQKGSAREEPVKEESAQKEPAHKESASQHVVFPKASPQEPTQKEPTRKGSTHEDSVKKDPAQKQPAQKEPASERVDLVKHARQTARQQATRQAPTKQEASREEEKASPGAFLAAHAYHDNGVAILMPLACACAATMASAFLAFRSCRRPLDIEHPLLG